MEWMIKHIKADWDTIVKEEERKKMITIANSHYLRALMDGDIIKKTQLVIPREQGTKGRTWW